MQLHGEFFPIVQCWGSGEQIFAFAEGIKLKPLFVCLKLQRKHMLFLSTFWLLGTCPGLIKFAKNYDIWKRSKIWIGNWYQDRLQPKINPKLVCSRVKTLSKGKYKITYVSGEKSIDSNLFSSVYLSLKLETAYVHTISIDK